MTMEYQTFSADELLGPFNGFEAKNAPKELYVRGNVGLLDRKGRVSIVGARECSRDGVNRAARLARMLVDKDIVVVSGLAKGIDRTAHEVAIESGGSTIGVIGTPLDKAYPAQNRDLQERIAREYLLVSQFPIGARTYRSSFPQRNRTMAILSDATVIIEAGESSGSLSQGWEAVRIGRPLFIAKSLFDGQLKWPHEMEQYGAQRLDEDSIHWLMETVECCRLGSSLDVLESI